MEAKPTVSDPWGSQHFAGINISFCGGMGIHLEPSEYICIFVMAQKWEDSVGRVTNLYERQVSFSSLWRHGSTGLSSRLKITLGEGGDV